MRGPTWPLLLAALAFVLAACGDGTPPPPETFTVTGTISASDDTPLEGVAVTFAYAGKTATTETIGDGTYASSEVQGEVVVTPAHPHYQFEPEERTATQATATDLDFTGLRIFNLDGLVTDDDGDPVPGVTIKLQYADREEEATTNEDGEWAHAGLYGEVTITPQDHAFTFTPSSTRTSTASADVDFQGELKACTSGDGSSKSDPCVITRLKQLPKINDNQSGHYALGSDIDAAPTRGWHAGMGFDPIGGFSGSLDGRGHTITGLFIDRPDQQNVGLFGSVSSDTASIENIALTDVRITGGNLTGALAGTFGATIRNASSTGRVIGKNDTGGLVGRNEGAIATSYSTSAVTGNTAVGGLAGRSIGGDIETSYSTGTVTGHERVGGLVGMASGTGGAGSVTNAYSLSPVTGANHVGGLIGTLGSYLTTSYSTGLVTATDATSSNVGGAIGSLNQGQATESVYWDRDTSEQLTSRGGLQVQGRSTDEMKERATFTGWDFTDVWTINEGANYPDLNNNPR